MRVRAGPRAGVQVRSGSGSGDARAGHRAVGRSGQEWQCRLVRLGFGFEFGLGVGFRFGFGLGLRVEG